MSLRLRIYVGLVLATAVALLAFGVPHDLRAHGIDYTIWFVVCVLSELMVVTVLSGEGTTSMASTANLATAMLWGQGPAIWIAALSTLAAERLLVKNRKPWIRATFNAAQTAITLWAATWVFSLLGAPREGFQSAGVPATVGVSLLKLALPTVGLAVTYLLVSRFLVSVAMAWSMDRKIWKVLREDWFYLEHLIEDCAAFLLAPLMVISFRVIQYLGVGLFFAPLYMIYQSSRRYIELIRQQGQLIQRERMAARGEMAAGISHNMRQQLTAISGRAQLLIKAAESGTFDKVEYHARTILDQTHSLERLSKTIMDSANANLKMEPMSMNDLVERSLELMKTQKRFTAIDWDIQLGESLPELNADFGQLQQVVLNLFTNAADAMEEHQSPTRSIKVTTRFDGPRNLVRLVVKDSGPGILPENIGRVFEKHFTTKKTGHGFGLSTSYVIVVNHGGKLAVESKPGDGAEFTMSLPPARTGSAA